MSEKSSSQTIRSSIGEPTSVSKHAGSSSGLSSSTNLSSEPQIHRLMRLMVKLGASDLHISAGKPLHYRLNGAIVKLNNNVLTKEECQLLLFEILTTKEQRDFIESWELDKSHGIDGVGRFRINLYIQKNGLSAAIRMIPQHITTMEELGLPPIIKTLANMEKGLVLVTGATGSGKSTTLASVIDHINTNSSKHIITIEDPIEFEHRDKKSIINQRELNNNTKSFANALRASLREDPDVILVGELRDLESISLAITAAETGHLVLSTLHASTAPSALDRLIDVFPSSQQAQIRTMLSESMKAIVSQKLFKLKSKAGRVAAFEILVNVPAVSNLIRENKTFQIKSVIQTGMKDGMTSFERSLGDLVDSGLIEQEDAEVFLGKKAD